jgi:regulator of protease activity HflC (stomatin/prohibitin superfamily)
MSDSVKSSTDSINEEGGSIVATGAHALIGSGFLVAAYKLATTGNTIAGLATAAVGLAFAANSVFSSFFTQTDNYSTVTTRFGQKMGNITGGGIKYKRPWPWRSVYQKVPVFTQSVPGELTDLQTHDNVTVKSVKYNLLYRIVDPATFAFSAANRIEQMSEIAANSVRAQIGNSIAINTNLHTDGNDGSHTSRFYDLKSDRQRMAKQILEDINPRLRQEYGIELVDVPMEQPVLDPRFTEAVAKRILAEQEGLAEELKMAARGRGISAERDAATKGLAEMAKTLTESGVYETKGEIRRLLELQMILEAQTKTKGIVILNAGGQSSDMQAEFLAAVAAVKDLPEFAKSDASATVSAPVPSAPSA